MDHYAIASKMKKLTLLYIEDDAEIQGYLAEFMGRYTSHLHLAQSAEQGQKIYEQYKPDIILLDINLPGKNGIEFARTLRESDLSTRIIITTAYTDQEFLLVAVELGLTRYLIKPVTSDELLYALNKATDELSNMKEPREKKSTVETPLINLGRGFTYNRDKKSLLKDNFVVPLRRKEMKLLEFFIANRNKIVTYESLEYEVWVDTLMSRDAIRAQIRNLRKKIYADLISNVTAIGYQLSKEVQ